MIGRGWAWIRVRVRGWAWAWVGVRGCARVGVMGGLRLDLEFGGGLEIG